MSLPELVKSLDERVDELVKVVMKARSSADALDAGMVKLLQEVLGLLDQVHDHPDAKPEVRSWAMDGVEFLRGVVTYLAGISGINELYQDPNLRMFLNRTSRQVLIERLLDRLDKLTNTVDHLMKLMKYVEW